MNISYIDAVGNNMRDVNYDECNYTTSQLNCNDSGVGSFDIMTILISKHKMKKLQKKTTNAVVDVPIEITFVAGTFEFKLYHLYNKTVIFCIK